MQPSYLEGVTDAQRNLLAQFELRAISAPENTPVIVVRRASMRCTEEASTTSSSSINSSHSPVSSQDAMSQYNKLTNHGTILRPEVTQKSLPYTSNEYSPSPDRRSSAANTMVPEKNSFLQGKQDEACPQRLVGHVKSESEQRVSAELEEGLCDVYVAGTVPLFHDSNENDTVGTQRGGAVALGKTDKDTSFFFDIAMRGKEANQGLNLDERCRDLAERLVQLSADVDAVEFKMNRSIPPPSEFF